MKSSYRYKKLARRIVFRCDEAVYNNVLGRLHINDLNMINN